jgi:simple sugar transport system permease protein
MQSFFSKHPRVSRIFDILLPFLATLAALGVGAVMLMIFDANPIVAYGAMLDGAFGSTNALADTLVKATPLLLVALGICIAFRGGVINIGGEGQLILGALASTVVGLLNPDMPGWQLIPLALLAGFVAGGFWGAIPGLLKAYFNVSEILSTIMMNAIAVQGMNYLLREPLIDPVQLEAASRRLPDQGCGSQSRCFPLRGGKCAQTYCPFDVAQRCSLRVGWRDSDIRSASPHVHRWIGDRFYRQCWV